MHTHTHNPTRTHPHTHTHTDKYTHTQRAEKIYIFSLFNITFPPFCTYFRFLSVLFVHIFFTMCNVLQATLVANIEYVPHVAQLQMGNVKKWLIDGCLERKLFLLSLCYITEISKNPSGLFFKFFCLHLNYIQVSYEQSLKLTRTAKLLENLRQTYKQFTPIYSYHQFSFPTDCLIQIRCLQLTLKSVRCNFAYFCDICPSD